MAFPYLATLPAVLNDLPSRRVVADLNRNPADFQNGEQISRQDQVSGQRRDQANSRHGARLGPVRQRRQTPRRVTTAASAWWCCPHCNAFSTAILNDPFHGGVDPQLRRNSYHLQTAAD